MNVSDLLTYGVLALVGVRLADGLRHSLRGHGKITARHIVSGIGWRHVWPVPFVVMAVALLAGLLMMIPGLSWGWWSLLGGEGNPVAGSTTLTIGSVWEWLIPIAFVAMVMPTLPLFALAEERIFRSGAEQWPLTKRLSKTLQFGLVHAIIGIPIGAALALTLGGTYFMVIYLRTYSSTKQARAALIECTRAHTAYNAMIMVVVLGLAVSTALG